jgi:O-methyltransferase
MVARVADRVARPLAARLGLRHARATPLDHLESVPLFGYDEEAEARADALTVRSHTMGSYERLVSLWQQVRYADRRDVPGALVECGVWKGGCVGMMALAHLRSQPTVPRRLHLFDSFEGLPEPDRAVDGALATDYSHHHDSGALKPIDQCVGPLDENRHLLEDIVGYPTDRISYHVGWFEETVARDAPAIGPIAVLRLDGDWYSSTRVCLENLYPLVSSGGVVVIDDYGQWEGCRKAVDEYLAKIGESPLLGHIDYTARYFVKP